MVRTAKLTWDEVLAPIPANQSIRSEADHRRGPDGAMLRAAMARRHLLNGWESAFLGSIELTMSVITILLQLFAIGRLTKRVGVAAMIVVVPLFVVGGFLLIAASPVLATLVAVFVARRVGQYAIVRPCREMLYTTVDRESKYKAKNVNDTLVYRTSDFVFAKAQAFIESAFQASLAGMALFGAAVAATWAAVAWGLGRAHERMADGGDRG